MTSPHALIEGTLLPCPFCGGEAKESYHNHSMTWSIRCGDWRCGSKTSCEALEPVVDAWNTRSPDLARDNIALREALVKIAAGSKLSRELFEARVRDRKDRLTWFAVNVLQDNLAACEGTASAALTQSEPSK